jgi:phosphatidate cytidylyltransferase
MASSLPRRIAVASIAIPLAAAMVYLGSWLLVAGLAVLGVVGSRELFGLAERAGVRAYRAPGYIGAVLAPVIALLVLGGGGGQPLEPLGALLIGTIWLLGTMGCAVARSGPSQRPILALAVTLFGPCYAAGLLAFVVLLRHGMSGASALTGTGLVFLPLVTTWVCDTLAMTGGSLFGGPRFAPVISPNKTWSGAVSGLVGAGIVAVTYGKLLLDDVGVTLTTWQLLAIGAVVGILGQLGDLAESLLKRSVGVKDSGTFFPGHGGVLDRLDSLYWVIPMSALCLYAFGVL